MATAGIGSSSPPNMAAPSPTIGSILRPKNCIGDGSHRRRREHRGRLLEPVM
jgi:hypothetical protein